MRCPNIKNDRVKTAMNALVKAYGGTPLSETEFISRHESDKREGIDKDAMNNMYRLYNRVPAEHSDGFIDRVLFEYAKPYIDPDIKDGSLVGLREYISRMSENVEDPNNYVIPGELETGTVFGTDVENFDLVKNNPDALDTITIGEYLGATNSGEITKILSDAGLRTYVDIPVGASVRAVMDFVLNRVFSLELIPEDMREKFLEEAKLELKGGSNDYSFSRLFRKMGMPAIEAFVHSKYYIGENRTIIFDGKNIGSFSVDDRGVFSMDADLIVPFVRINSGERLVIKSTSLRVCKELNKLGYRTRIIGSELIVLPRTGELAMSVSDARENLDKLHTTVRDISEKFFKNVKAAHRITSPAISMLLDSSSMTLPELVDWVNKSMKDSYSLILNEIGKANDKMEFSTADEQSFVNMHIIEDELLPFLYDLVAAMRSVNLGSEYDSAIKDMLTHLNKIEFEISSFTTMYIMHIESYLAKRYGYDVRKFNSNSERGRKDIKPFLYIFKYAEKSSNYDVRLSVALIKDLMSKRFIEERKYRGIDDLYLKLKKSSVSEASLYEKKRNRKSVTTGYLMDKIHRGSFNDELVLFNKVLHEKFGADGMYDRFVSDKDWKEYRKTVNDWMKRHTILPMDSSYLDAISTLSKDTYIQYMDSRAAVSRIFSELSGDDIAMGSGLFERFIESYKEYLELFSVNDMTGEPKREGSKERRIADELNRFREIFNPENTEAASEKYEEFKNALETRLKNKEITHPQYSKLINAFSGFSDGSSHTTSSEPVSQFRAALMIHTANGLDRNAFVNASKSIREFMFDILDPSEVGNPIMSNEFHILKDLYIKNFGDEHVKKMEEDGLIKNPTAGTYGIVNPLFYTYPSQNKDTNKPSSIFSFDKTTFNAESSNPLFDTTSPFKMQPNPTLYSNKDYDSLSDEQKDLIEDIKKILLDINSNNGTISLYGPLLPQISSGFASRGMRRVASTYNPFQAILYPLRTKYFYNNESLSGVIGFKKEANIPSSLYSKNSQILIDPNTISRDITKILSKSYTDSLTNKVSTSKLFAFKSIIDRAKDKRGVNTPGAASVMASMVRTFLGTEEVIEGGHKAGSLNTGAIVNSLIGFMRMVHLSFKWLTIASNAVVATIATINDGLFINRKDLLGSIPKLIEDVTRFSINSFTGGDIGESKFVNMMKLSGAIPDSESRHTKFYGARFGKFVSENFWFGGYRLSDVMSLHPIAHSVFKSIKYYDGEFHNLYSFIDKYADNTSNAERKRLKKKFLGLKEDLYDAFLFEKNGDFRVVDKFKDSNALDVLEMARSIIRSKHRTVAGNKAESLSPSADTVLSPQIMVYRGWMINALNVLLSRKYYDPIVRQDIESQFVSLGRMIAAASTYIPYLSNMYRYYEDQNGAPADRRELTQYQIDNGMVLIRNFGAMMTIQILAASVYAVLMQSIMNGDADDDESNLTPMHKIMTMFSTLSFRVVEEISSMYNPLSFLDIFGMANPILSTFSGIVKNANSAMSILEAKELMSETAIDNVERMAGKSLNRIAAESMAGSLPGGAGVLATDRAINGKRSSFRELSWYYGKNWLAEPMYKAIDIRTNPNSPFIEGNIKKREQKKKMKSYEDGSGLRW